MRYETLTLAQRKSPNPKLRPSNLVRKSQYDETLTLGLRLRRRDLSFYLRVTLRCDDNCIIKPTATRSRTVLTWHHASAIVGYGSTMYWAPCRDSLSSLPCVAALLDASYEVDQTTKWRPWELPCHSSLPLSRCRCSHRWDPVGHHSGCPWWLHRQTRLHARSGENTHRVAAMLSVAQHQGHRWSCNAAGWSFLSLSLTRRCWRIHFFGRWENGNETRV
jgi:hypothetical protein